MEKIPEKARMILRNVYIALGATAMPMLVHAGYGQRQPDLSSYTVPVQGRVVSEETGKPVAGINVNYNNWARVKTDSVGRFLIYVPEEDSYAVSFYDTDGFENSGYFLYKDMTITRDEIADPLEVSLYRESQVAVIRGTVRSKGTGEPVSGIRVLVSGNDNGSESGYIPFFEVLSGKKGQFSIKVPMRDAYFVSFTDYNGLFQRKQINVTSDEIKDSLKVDLEQNPKKMANKFPQFIFNQFRKNETHLHQLSYLFWECTRRCSMKCLHCGSDCSADSKTKDLPFDDFLGAILPLKEVYKPDSITGGEPLMREDLPECGRRLRQHGFHWGIVTNGYARQTAWGGYGFHRPES